MCFSHWEAETGGRVLLFPSPVGDSYPSQHGALGGRNRSSFPSPTAGASLLALHGLPTQKPHAHGSPGRRQQRRREDRRPVSGWSSALSPGDRGHPAPLCVLVLRAICLLTMCAVLHKAQRRSLPSPRPGPV